jgi:hypothetical protein
MTDLTDNLIIGSSGGGGDLGSSLQDRVADIQEFIQYLKQFVPVLLDANCLSISEFEKCMNEKAYVDCIKKFMSDPQTRSLVIQKVLTKGSSDLVEFELPKVFFLMFCF